MLDVKDPKYLEEVREFARSTNRAESLESGLQYLEHYADHEHKGLTRCIVMRDFAPHSFLCIMQKRQEGGQYQDWFTVGLIYHGPHDGFGDGGAPTFSCSLVPNHGWELHT